MTYSTVLPKSNFHHKIPVKTKNWTGKCLRQEVCVLLLRLYGDNVKLSPEYKLSEEVVPNVDVFRIRRAHRVMSQVPCPLGVLKNSDACRTKARQNKTPHVPQENRFLDGVCQCHVLGFCGRKRHALLSPRKPAHACSCAHDSPTGNRPPTSGIAGVVCIRIRNQLQPTVSLKSNAKITREKNIPGTRKCQPPSSSVSPWASWCTWLPLSLRSQYPDVSDWQATSSTLPVHGKASRPQLQSHRTLRV